MEAKVMFTKEEKKQMITDLLEQVQKEIDICTMHVEAPMLVRCNCIVATEDCKYQLGVRDSKADVLIGDFSNPVWFTKAEAERLAREVKASNGYGPLKFVVWGWKSFFAKRRENLLPQADTFKELLAKVS